MTVCTYVHDLNMITRRDCLAIINPFIRGLHGIARFVQLYYAVLELFAIKVASLNSWVLYQLQCAKCKGIRTHERKGGHVQVLRMSPTLGHVHTTLEKLDFLFLPRRNRIVYNRHTTVRYRDIAIVSTN